MKLETENVKNDGTPRKINAILFNIKINRLKLVSMCRYGLTTSWQNFTEIYLTWVKISQKVLGGTFFDSHCSYKLDPSCTCHPHLSVCHPCTATFGLVISHSEKNISTQVHSMWAFNWFSIQVITDRHVWSETWVMHKILLWISSYTINGKTLQNVFGL